MRILVAQNVGRARNGGMSRIMGKIHDEIASAGHVIEYFGSEEVKGTFSEGRLSRFVFPAAVVSHVRWLQSNGRPVDVVNVHEPSGSALVLARSLLHGIKIVVTSHGVEQRSWDMRFTPEASASEWPSLKTRIAYPATVLWQTRIALRKADHIFCLNEDDREYLLRRFQRKPGEITRIFPAADPVFGRSARSRDYRRCRRILFAGTWLHRKGTQYLIEAFSRLSVKYPQLELVILNPGVPPQLVKDAFVSVVRSRVQCMITGEEEETVNAFEEADLFVLPSLFEGTPLTLLEAMWSGLPIVTTSTCGMKDVIQNERNGLLVPVRSAEAIETAIGRLVEDETLRWALGTAASREASEKLRWQDSAGKVLAQYERLLGE